MSLYEGLLAVHVLMAVVWVGGATALQFMGTRIRTSRDAAAMSTFGMHAEWIGQHIFMPASIVALASGIWLVVEGSWGFTKLWIIFGLVGIAFSAIVGATFLGPESAKVGGLMAEHGFDNPEVEARLNRLVTIARIENVILLLIVLNMAIKPGS